MQTHKQETWVQVLLQQEFIPLYIIEIRRLIWIHAIEKTFLREILNKTKDRIRNANIRLKLGVYEIKNDFQWSRLRWLGHVMQITEERMHKIMLHAKMEGKWPRGRPRTKWIDKVRKDIEMWGENMLKWKKDSGTYLTTVCRHRWSRQITVAASSSNLSTFIIICLLQRCLQTVVR